jgi:hypothetical protein
LGAGLAVLALSRPFEGLLLSLVPLIGLAVRFLGPARPPAGAVLGRCVVPLALVLGPTVLWMGYYHWRVTEDPLKMPYQAHEDRYGMVPVFVFQPLKPEPPYRHDVQRLTHAVASRDHFLRYRTWDGLAAMSIYKAQMLWKFFIDLLLTPAWLGLLAAVPRRWTAAAMGAVGLVFLGSLLSTWAMPHYISPITAPMFYLNIQAVRRFRRWGLPGRLYAAVLPVALAVMVAAQLVVGRGYPPESWHFQRDTMERALSAGFDRHIVVVRYGPGHETGQEWVYNRADLDGAPVIWAHDMGDDRNQRLLQYFAGRKAWLLELPSATPRPVPYPRRVPSTGATHGNGH